MDMEKLEDKIINCSQASLSVGARCRNFAKCTSISTFPWAAFHRLGRVIAITSGVTIHDLCEDDFVDGVFASIFVG